MTDHTAVTLEPATPPAPAPLAPPRLRVLLVISNMEYGGAQRQIVELANSADPDRMEFHVCSLSAYAPLAQALRLPEERFHVIEKKGRFDLSVVPKLARLLRRIDADVVHSYLFDAEIAARLAGRLAGTLLIVGSERNADYTLKRVQLAAYRITRNQVDVIIANSNAGAAFNARTLGQPPNRYRVVHNGVDTVRFQPGDRTAAKRQMNLPEQAPVVGMFASFKKQKNHPLLFAAARRVLAHVPNALFLFVGEELHAGMHGSREYRAAMDAMVDQLGLRPNCVFLGNQDHVERLYPACDVTVLPSLFEGTPNVALESLACGVPVVATDVSDNARIIPDGVAGFVVPLGDEEALAERLARLLTNTELRFAMSTQARTWAEREFSTQRLAEKTEAVYREWLDRTGRGAA